MDLWDLTRLLLRRWYFAVPMMLASVATVILAAQMVSPDYKAMGYMQLIPAPSAGKIPDPKAKPGPANPWLDLGYAALGNAAALTVTDQTSLEKLAAEGYSDSVTVVLNERTPLFEIEAVGNSRQQATGTVQKMIKLLQADILAKQKQYGALPDDTISTLVINDGSTTQQESGKIKRVVIVAAGLGILLTTASTIVLDYWLRRRRYRDEAPEDAGAAPEDAGEAPEPRANGTAAASQVAQHAALLDAAEKTRILWLPTLGRPPQQPVLTNRSVYPGERRQSEVNAPAARPASGVRGDSGSPEREIGDVTVVLPASFPPRRSPVPEKKE